MLRKSLWILVCCSLYGPASEAQVVRGPEVRSTEEYGRVFYDPKHDPWEMPDQIVATMGIKNSDNVAEVGYGVGYFSRRFAKFAQKVFAIDPNPNALAAALFEAPENLSVLANFPPGQLLDKLLLHNALSTIPNRSMFFSTLPLLIRKKAEVYIVDFYKTPPADLPPESRITADTVIAEMKQAGFQLEASYDFLPFQYFLVFTQ